jgi:hypothetical protein
MPDITAFLGFLDLTDFVPLMGMPYEVFRKSRDGKVTDHYRTQTLRSATMWVTRLAKVVQRWETVVLISIPQPPEPLPDAPEGTLERVEHIKAWVAQSVEAFDDFEEDNGYRGADAD